MIRRRLLIMAALYAAVLGWAAFPSVELWQTDSKSQSSSEDDVTEGGYTRQPTGVPNEIEQLKPVFEEINKSLKTQIQKTDLANSQVNVSYEFRKGLVNNLPSQFIFAVLCFLLAPMFTEPPAGQPPGERRDDRSPMRGSQGPKVASESNAPKKLA